MDTIRHHRVRTVATLFAAAALMLSACGDDGDDADDSDATEAPSDVTEGGGDGEQPEVCALAQQMADQESFPTAEQLEQYQTEAPDEIADSVSVAVEHLAPVAGDDVAFFAAFAEDEVEAAVMEINAFETDACGIPHEDEGGIAGEGATGEIEDGAVRVDVVATDYTFDMPEALEAGRTTFVLTNDGSEAHFLFIGSLDEGATVESVMASESGINETWSGGLAAPGGEDDEVLTFDLEPGNYVVACFVPGADGTPHAFMGMAQELTVT
ncbi:MAG TPA: hypothetical protein VL916_07660 [Ilumatobacteraceae bacterium]|nr:hypothetical protein [Ilumatobacteraceae bacterium]